MPIKQFIRDFAASSALSLAPATKDTIDPPDSSVQYQETTAQPVALPEKFFNREQRRAERFGNVVRHFAEQPPRRL